MSAPGGSPGPKSCPPRPRSCWHPSVRAARAASFPVAQLVHRDGPQPGAKAAGLVVLKIRQLLHQDDEHLLHEVGRVRFLQSRPRRPVEQHRRIEMNEPQPGGIRRRLTSAFPGRVKDVVFMSVEIMRKSHDSPTISRGVPLLMKQHIHRVEQRGRGGKSGDYFSGAPCCSMAQRRRSPKSLRAEQRAGSGR